MKNKYIIKFSKLAIKDIEKLKKAKLYDNYQIILDKMLQDPFCYPPSYEKLVGDLSGFYSRRNVDALMSKNK